MNSMKWAKLTKMFKWLLIWCCFLGVMLCTFYRLYTKQENKLIRQTKKLDRHNILKKIRDNTKLIHMEYKKAA